MSAGGQRPGAGRPAIDPSLKKIPYATKLPAWLKAWLLHPERSASGPELIEKALRKVHKIGPPAA